MNFETQSSVTVEEICYPQYHVGSPVQCILALHPRLNKLPHGFSQMSPH